MAIIVDWIKNHLKIVIVLLVVFVMIVAASIARCSVVQSAKEEAEQQKQEQGPYCELTNKQREIAEDYDNETQEVVDFLKNSKWVDNSGNKALFMYDSYFVERANEDETTESFAICAVETEKTKISSVHTQTTYRLTILNSKSDYENATLVMVKDGESSSSALISANLQSDKLFANATTYNRISNTDSFNIEGWDDNANQFIQDKYSELYSCIKDYCSKYYPQIATASWSNLVTIDYQTHQISYPFTIKTTSYYTLTVTYNQDDGSFVCSKAKSS